jgi:hypothetical protein
MADKWDRSNKAPKSLFRVIGEDSFEMPPANYWVGDYKTYEEARATARSCAKPLNPMCVYDDLGKLKFLIA